MNFAYELTHASGLTLDDCSCICHRWDDQWALGHDNGESFVVDFQGDDNLVERQVPALYTGLWRSPGGAVYVSHSRGRMFRRSALGAPWSIVQLADAMYGVWGLDDDCVFAWGSRDGQPVMFVWNGTDWREMASPPGFVNALHGTRRDLLIAVGSQGLIATWDGNAWRRMASPIRTALSSVFVVSADEAYACGPGDHALLEGSVYGWSPILHHETPLHAVAKYAGSVYVGAGLNGLHVLDGTKLSLVALDLRAVKLDTRGGLLVSAQDRVAFSTDGVDFDWFTIDGVRLLIDAIDPCFG